MEFIESIIAQDKVCVLDVEIQGAKMIHDSGYQGILCFIKPPSFESLHERLVLRYFFMRNRLGVRKKKKL